MLDSELDQNKINSKGFMRLNSLEDEQETMPEEQSYPITETPKRQIVRQHKSASYYHHRTRHRTHQNNHWHRQLMYQQQQHQQQLWWNQQFYYSPLPSTQITQVPYNSLVAKGCSYTWPNSDNSFHLSPKAVPYPSEAVVSNNSFHLNARAAYQHSIEAVLSDNSFHLSSKAGLHPGDNSFHSSAKAVAHTSEASDRGFPLRVNNFLPELSFADHAAMAAAAMESAEPTQHVSAYNVPSLLSNQISKTFSSLVGGVCSWVAGTLEARLLGASAAFMSGQGGPSPGVLGPVSLPSTLNPHAKSFVPLNPNAKEFRPKGAPTPDTETEIVPEVKKMPEKAPMTPESAPNTPEKEADLTDLDDFDSPIPCYESSEDDDSESEEEDDPEDIPRGRTVSVGSDDSDFIVFEDNDARCEELRRNVGSCGVPKCDNNALVGLSIHDIIVVAVEDDEEGEDVVDAASLPSPDEILNLFQSQLNLDTLTPRTKENEGHTNGHGKEPHPCLTPRTPENWRIEGANRSWNEVYASTPTSPKCSGSRVCFSECSNVVIYEDPELSEELASARQSDFPQRQADKERMERLIGPILTETHRDKVRTRLMQSVSL